ncbi:hypothetical protein MP228_000707 [Amoeboaphelidium protococcarum]|nr:hypothetical protein MP228_000707 [Amoeboaphelidium protococcarum]
MRSIHLVTVVMMLLLSATINAFDGFFQQFFQEGGDQHHGGDDHYAYDGEGGGGSTSFTGGQRVRVAALTDTDRCDGYICPMPWDTSKVVCVSRPIDCPCAPSQRKCQQGSGWYLCTGQKGGCAALGLKDY